MRRILIILAVIFALFIVREATVDPIAAWLSLILLFYLTIPALAFIILGILAGFNDRKKSKNTSDPNYLQYRQSARNWFVRPWYFAMYLFLLMLLNRVASFFAGTNGPA